MSGLLITQIASMHPEKVSQLVYMAAFIGRSGDSLLDCSERHHLQRSATILRSITGETMTLDPKSARQYLYNETRTLIADKAMTQLCSQSMTSFKARYRYNSLIISPIPKHYLVCTKDNVIPESMQRAMASELKCQVHTLNADHSPFFSMPEKLEAVLRRIVA